MPDSRIEPLPHSSRPVIDLRHYNIFDPPDPFEDHVGPFYYRISGDTALADSVHCVLPTAGKMTNAGGVLHGGVLLTFADYALCLVAGRAADKGTNTSFALTVSLTAEFLAAGEIGPPVEARGQPLRVTGSLAFARGVVTQGGRTLMTWSGTCRHVPRVKAMARKAAAGSPTRAPFTAQTERPEGYAPLLRGSPFSDLTGPVWFRREPDAPRVHVVQPTLPNHCNSGGVIHGGMLMTFADNALCTALTAICNRAPSTVVFSAEFMSAGTAGPPLESRVEVPQASRHLGFTRGTVCQGDRVLVNYNAVAALRDWSSVGGGE